jgi:hypothetical protein
VDLEAAGGWFTWRLGEEDISFFHSHDVARSDFRSPSLLP